MFFLIIFILKNKDIFIEIWLKNDCGLVKLSF